MEKGPEWYARSVSSFSKQGQDVAYYSGSHYGKLGRFLMSPYQIWSQRAENAEETEHNLHFPFVVLCDLSKHDEDPRRCITYQLPEDLGRCQPTTSVRREPVNGVLRSVQRVPTNLSGADISIAESSEAKRHGRIVFLHGFPSARWLNHVGATFMVDPELFMRHLLVSKPAFHGLSQATRQLEVYYRTPSPNTRDLIELRICNTGSWSTASPGSTLHALRTKCLSGLEKHLEDFSRLQNLNVGSSIVRRFFLHDLNNFTIEQKISVEVIHNTDPWSVIVWSDTGSHSHYKNSRPWLDVLSPFGTTLYPVFQHYSRMALDAIFAEKSPHPQDGFAQSVDHLSKQYGRRAKSELMAEDAFYALHELFEFSAASIDQLLVVLEATVSNSDPSIGDSTATIELLLNKAVADDYGSYLQELTRLIRSRGGADWPKAASRTRSEEANRAALELLDRYQELIRRMERFSQVCTDRISVATNAAFQRQTEKAIEQTDKLKKLSVLAYVYIPLTFAAGFFGMNFKEIGVQLSIWVYFALALPLLAISLFAWFVDPRRILQAMLYFHRRTQH